MTKKQRDPDDTDDSQWTQRLQTTDPDEMIFRYADRYDRARAEDNDAEVPRSLLFNELQRYRRFLVGGDEPHTTKRTWTPLQRTVRFASIYAETYLTRKSPSDTVETIKVRLAEEERYIPHGVGEWVVERVRDPTTGDLK